MVSIPHNDFIYENFMCEILCQFSVKVILYVAFLHVEFNIKCLTSREFDGKTGPETIILI